MWEILEREGIYLWFYFSIQLKQIFLYWVIGIMAGSVISVFAKAKIHAALSRIDDRKWGLFGIFPASLLGILSPLCMYGTIPIAASFAAKGVREDWLASFMMSSMLLNPQLILYSAALGRTMLTIRIVTCLLCGVSAGLLLHFCFRKKKFFRFEGMQEPENHDTDPRMPVRLLKNIWRNIKVTGPYFLVGIVLSALFQRYVPAESFASLFGEGNKGFGLLMAATLGVPMYVLSNTQKSLGAACILYDGVLKSCAARLGEAYYVLPSSIHEVIMVPVSAVGDEQELSAMVRDINRTQVRDTEILSDNIYLYSPVSGKLTLIES